MGQITTTPQGELTEVFLGKPDGMDGYDENKLWFKMTCSADGCLVADVMDELNGEKYSLIAEILKYRVKD